MLGYIRLILFILIFYQIPLFGQSLKPNVDNLIDNGQYSLYYDSKYHIPTIVYYTIEYDKLGDYGREDFHNDYPIESSSSGDYTNSGYDRGHMFPSASSNSSEFNHKSFDMINILPQLPKFNRGIWKQIENFERNNCKNILYVICGIIKSDKDSKLGNILVPYKFYKALYNKQRGEMIGFIVTQDDNDFFLDHAVSIDSIESIIKVDLFYELDDKIENNLESKFNLNNWY